MHNLYDVIIVGGGPAGLSAAIYMARAKYKTLVIEKNKIGGQILVADQLVNYPGVINTSGEELTKNMKKQAENFGAKFIIEEVNDMKLDGEVKTISTKNQSYKALSIILAMGASPRKIGFVGEDKFAGRGVAYCATCDAEFFKDKPIYVIGDSHEAILESLFLTKYASKVYMIVKGSSFLCDKESIDTLLESNKVEIIYNSEVESVYGLEKMQSIIIKNNLTNTTYEEFPESGFGIFVFAGNIPNTSWSKGALETSNGYFITDIYQKTNIEGVYAAGDVCQKPLRQVATAVGDGAIAATSVCKYVSKLKRVLKLDDFIEENKKDDLLISEDIKNQLIPFFEKFKNEVIVKVFLDKSEFSIELENFIDEFSLITKKVIFEKEVSLKSSYLEIVDFKRNSYGVYFYTLPSGHEFNSFLVSLYNISCLDLKIDNELLNKIETINKKIDIKVLVSLTCSMCPEVVMACNKLAISSEFINSSIIDIFSFPNIKEKYNIMSVPCIVINDEFIEFGKKDINQIIDIILNV